MHVCVYMCVCMRVCVCAGVVSKQHNWLQCVTEHHDRRPQHGYVTCFIYLLTSSNVIDKVSIMLVQGDFVFYLNLNVKPKFYTYP